MLSFTSVFALTTALTFCVADFKTCERTYTKYGCFRRSKELLPDLLATNRDKSSDQFTGVLLDWNNFQASLHDLACRCAKLASEQGYHLFAIGYYGECFAGKNREKFDKWVKNGGTNKCIGGDYKTCDQNSEEECTGVENTEFVFALPQKAPEEEKAVDGGLSEWSSYTPCSVSCGAGFKERERQCNNPAPENGGKDCSELGELSETAFCQEAECPVNGNFTEWGDYSECSASCGGGVQSRSRSCTNPAPAHGGEDCDGPSKEEQKCNEQACPVNGGFSKWSDYSACSKTCGGGSKVSTRSCNNPRPANGGADCVGETSQSLSCNTQPCLGTWNCEWKYTEYNDDGGAFNSLRAVFLDRHHPDCGEDKAINGFQLQRNSAGNQYRYRYKCCSTQLKCSRKFKENDFTIDGAAEGDPIYLDRQNVQCNDQFLSSFGLVRKVGGGYWKYQYNCCEIKYSRQCVDKSTNFDTDGGKQTIYLDRHFVECPMYYGISRFQLNRNAPDGTKYRYNYRCCRAVQP